MNHLPDESRTGRETLEVALIALVRSGVGGWEVLLTRRGVEVHLGGFWELPGGKVESGGGETQGEGESPRIAACRELWEELGLTLRPEQLVACGSTSHVYPDRAVRFHVFMLLLRNETGIDVEQIKRDHAWARMDQLDAWRLPPANAAINQLVRQRLSEM